MANNDMDWETWARLHASTYIHRPQTPPLQQDGCSSRWMQMPEHQSIPPSTSQPAHLPGQAPAALTPQCSSWAHVRGSGCCRRLRWRRSLSPDPAHELVNWAHGSGGQDSALEHAKIPKAVQVVNSENGRDVMLPAAASPAPSLINALSSYSKNKYFPMQRPKDQLF